MSFEKETDGTYTLTAIHDHGSIPLVVTGEPEGLKVGGCDVIPWSVIDELRGVTNEIIKFGRTYTLADNSKFVTETYFITTQCAIQVASSLNNSMPMDRPIDVEYSVNDFTTWTSAPRIVVPGDKVKMRFTTPSNGTSIFYIVLDHIATAKVTVNVNT